MELFPLLVPAGGDTEVQFNDGLLFGSDSTFTFNKATDTLTAGSAIIGPSSATFQPAADSTSAFQWLDQDGGSPVLNIDTTNERLGILTNVPTVPMDIAGSTSALRVRAGNPSGAFTSDQMLMSFNGGALFTHAIKTRHHSTTSSLNAMDFYLWQSSDASSDVGTKNVLSMLGTGNVGIGTTSPDTTLQVVGDCKFGDDDTNYVLFASEGILSFTGLAGVDVLVLNERSSDPSKPLEGKSIMWMSDGTVYGDDGDVIVASTSGGTTTRAVLYDKSTGSAW